MIRLRPYKSCDAELIAGWLKKKEDFLKWGGTLFGPYPVTAGLIDDKYRSKNGDCVEPDNFYPFTAFDYDTGPIGHLIMRYMNGDKRALRFGWVVIDDAKRGKGYGFKMICAGLKYAFEILGVDRVTLGVYESNEPAHRCYRKAGFNETAIVNKEPWNVIEMEIKREEYKRIYGR